MTSSIARPMSAALSQGPVISPDAIIGRRQGCLVCSATRVRTVRAASLILQGKQAGAGKLATAVRRCVLAPARGAKQQVPSCSDKGRRSARQATYSTGAPFARPYAEKMPVGTAGGLRSVWTNGHCGEERESSTLREGHTLHQQAHQQAHASVEQALSLFQTPHARHARPHGTGSQKRWPSAVACKGTCPSLPCCCPSAVRSHDRPPQTTWHLLAIRPLAVSLWPSCSTIGTHNSHDLDRDSVTCADKETGSQQLAEGARANRIGPRQPKPNACKSSSHGKTLNVIHLCFSFSRTDVVLMNTSSLPLSYRAPKTVF